MYNFLKKLHLSPYLAVALSFLILVFLGSFFLSLPISYQNRNWPNYVNALFMSFSAVCLTGLSVFPNIVNTFSIFGKVVLIILVQLGGLGFITIFTFVITLFRRRINMLDRFVLKEAMGASEYSGVIRLIRNMVIISLTIELIGVIPYLIVFIPEFGFWPGIGKSVFQSISSFNNTGFDIVSTSGLIPYRHNFIITFNTATLTTLGGLGFLTISELLKFKKPKLWRSQTKIVITMTLIIISTMTLLLFLANLGSKDPLNLYESFFTIAVSRTGGFAISKFSDMSQIGLLIVILTMFIGASPLSTGSGIKVTTLFVVVLITFAYIRGKKAHAFKRTYSQKSYIQATVVIFFALIAILIGYIMLAEFEKSNTAIVATGWGENALIFEVVSAFTTTGSSFGITPMLTDASKITLSILMFIGRVGPLTLMATVSESISKEEKLHYRYIESDILVG